MKKALPANAKIAKDAKETVQECISEYISFITSEYAPRYLPTLATMSGLPSAFTAAVPARQLPSRCTKLCKLQLHMSLHTPQCSQLVHLLLPTGCICASLSYRASDKCQREKRKTINGDDLLWAMSTLGFEDCIEPLKLYLHKFREGEKASLAKQGGDSLKKDASGASSGQMPMSNFGPSSTMGYMQSQMQLQPSQQL
eukprot:SM000036S13299  [mRNA]  locus=s36:459411:461026:- [translate_table: standard]